jgi:hypothetical protein
VGKKFKMSDKFCTILGLIEEDWQGHSFEEIKLRKEGLERPLKSGAKIIED